MKSLVVVHDHFLHSWIYALDRIHERWDGDGDLEIIQVGADDERSLADIVPAPETVDRLVSLRVPVTVADLHRFPKVKELGIDFVPGDDIMQLAEESGVAVYHQTSEGFWGESVSECALALTLCGLRRIPQLHHEIVSSQAPWDYSYRKDSAGPMRGGQFSDDRRFTNGVVTGKKVRVVGVGNIGSRYVSFMKMLGADVAAWDPFATDPCFHRAGARKVYHLDQLVQDAEIFAPMLPLKDTTTGIVTSEHIKALPKGCLVVLITRAKICDTDAIRERVLADEIALAADVHDIEPLPLDDPLVGRHNVVHTPHIAGRTRHAGEQWVDMLFDQFRPAAEKS